MDDSFESPPQGVPFREAWRAWVRVAVHSFGGPAGQIAVIHRVVVDEKRWVDEEHFLHALSYCMLLPGPEAQQLATYLGWLLHGTRGGLTAGLLFVLPGFLSILLLSLLYVTSQEVAFVSAVFYGLKPAVLAIVLEAVFRLKRRAVADRQSTAIAALAFLAIFAFGVPFPLIVLSAALVGYILGRPGDVVPAPRATAAPIGYTLRTAALWLGIWLVPVFGLVLALGHGHVLVQEALFFSKAAVVTFGGAYAVLAYVAQQAVDVYHWLGPGEMLDGLGLAETTPGPLIMVTQFVGFVGASRQPGDLHPLLAGVAGSVVTTWVTFTPCFLFVLAGAPWIERLRGNRGLNAALRGIMAAVVGVVLNLAVWFALHAVFTEVRNVAWGPLALPVPGVSSLDLGAAAIAGLAAFAVFRLKWGMFAVLGAGAAAGVLIRLLVTLR
jgi:chromate transporter